ncbi:uncharacterized protein A1O9_12971 [Exophiala aquamarina CBS 119918]|uniref:Cytochrome P450 oxidoreductase n=1 Tax=Exophiala aquamarina CBS 119918 TaxID=1182545 RepID=A0A072NV87_9EURO|nr:uncharacterized protein A1O9_12971 [Exophiala aquamarina CBS 119918]KEF50973.1 hypothetical protein A1O9_12971 [Exophiala aquamarina CBS 119918]
MLLDISLPDWTLPLICVVAITARFLYNKFGYGISRIPGPFLASYTDLWRFFLVWGGRAELTHIKLHEKYGPLVRIGPKNVSVSDSGAVKLIYGLGAGYAKSGFYPVQQPVTKDGFVLQGLFSTTDEKYHAKLRRAVANAYAMSTLVQFEPFVDSTTTEFLKQLSQRYADKPDTVCDFSRWLQFYAFDVIGELTFSKRLGFVDHGIDVDNIIRDNERMLGYFAVVGQVPILDKLLLKNPIRLLCSRMGLINATSPVAFFAKTRMEERLDSTHPKSKEGGRHHDSKRDFLSRFMEAGNKDPTFMNRSRILSLTAANMFAGSDTTAISLRSIFYFLLKNPSKLHKLQQELNQKEHDGFFSRKDRLVRWAEANELSYLGAVIKESLRIHPAAGLPLERVVPLGGTEISGRYLPAGTVVGCSAWTIHRSKEIFGKDVDAFRPERWLEDPANISNMNQSLFTFGAGARTCVGKNISYLEMYKLVPAIFRTFDVQLANPSEEWHLENKWFVKQSNFYVQFTAKGRKV